VLAVFGVARDLADLARCEPGFSVRTDATRLGAPQLRGLIADALAREDP
jgi:hypothetical protein